MLMCRRSEADTMQSQELCVVCKEKVYFGFERAIETVQGEKLTIE